MRLSPITLLICLSFSLVGCETLPNRNGEMLPATEMVAAQKKRFSDFLDNLNAPEKARQAEVEKLFNQSKIDPLTEYLENRPNDLRYIPHRQRVARERDRRCEAIGQRYEKEEPTEANLRKMRSAYSRSCYAQVQAFEQRVAQAEPETAVATAQEPAPKAVAPQPSTPPAPTPKPAPPREPAVAATPRPAPAPNTNVNAKASSEAANNCYLLYAIKNYQQAHQACIRVARDGNAKAQHHMASLARIAGEAEAALHWSTLSAEQRHAPGQMLLADLYQKGEGTPKNDERALRLLEQAADQGLAEARYKVGQAYMSGTGAPADPKRAAQYLERAAAQNHVPAQLALAQFYSGDVQSDPAKAREWLTRAANQESAEAQYNLGISYSNGAEVNNVEAYVWLSRAMLNGESRARQHLERIASSLSAEELEIAQKRVQSGMAGRRS